MARNVDMAAVIGGGRTLGDIVEGLVVVGPPLMSCEKPFVVGAAMKSTRKNTNAILVFAEPVCWW